MTSQASHIPLPLSLLDNYQQYYKHLQQVATNLQILREEVQDPQHCLLDIFQPRDPPEWPSL